MERKDMKSPTTAQPAWIGSAQLELVTAEVRQLRAIFDRIKNPSDEMRRAVAANWGKRTWGEYHTVIGVAINEAVTNGQ